MPVNARAFGARRRALLKIGCLILLIVAANIVADWIVDILKVDIRPSNEDLVHRMIIVFAAAYAVLIATPFVPGVEIGLTLIGMLGPAIVFLVYVATLAGLSIGFAAGRLVPLRWLVRLFDDLHLTKVSRLLGTIESMNGEERLAFLTSSAPNRFIPFMLRHRYIALAVIVNLPGNILIGGGGGIALMAGTSRLYSVPGFLATIALAVAPVPLAIVMFGQGILPA